MEFTIYQKTPAGVQEISARSAGLSFRERQLLIVIDGQMSLAELTGLMPIADLMPRIEKLQQAGLIILNVASSAAQPAADRPLPSAEILAEIRSILQQGNMLYLGGAFTTILQTQFDRASKLLELHNVIVQWNEALHEQGKSRYAEQQVAQMAQLIRFQR